VNIATFERRVEREFLARGKYMAQPVYSRIDELVERLKVYFPITGLRMAMGGYWLLGKDVEIVYDDDSTGRVEMTELLDYTEGKVWQPRALTQRNDKMLRELKSLLDWLTDAPYIPLYQFGTEPKQRKPRNPRPETRRFCNRCGVSLTSTDFNDAKRCTNCGNEEIKR
jgi:hypothetical protein